MKHKSALVTQATAFVGPAAVAQLSQDGFRVYAQDPAFADQTLLAEFHEQFPDCQTSSLTEPQALCDWAWQHSGGLDVLVSNDAHPAMHCPIEQASLDTLQTTLQQLLVLPFSLMQAAIPRFKKAKHGSVIMITSCRDELPMAGGAIPDMARAGANALVRSLSIELAPFNIAVNAIAPNFYYSEAYFPKAQYIDDPKGRAFIESAVPLGRLGRADEIGALVSYLASLPGAFHTGSVIKVAGGWPAAPQRPGL